MAPEFHRFDFWIGTWDVYETGGRTTVAYLLVNSVLDGKWVTNRRELLVIEGHFLNLGGLVPPLLLASELRAKDRRLPRLTSQAPFWGESEQLSHG